MGIYSVLLGLLIIEFSLGYRLDKREAQDALAEESRVLTPVRHGYDYSTSYPKRRSVKTLSKPFSFEFMNDLNTAATNEEEETDEEVDQEEDYHEQDDHKENVQNDHDGSATQHHGKKGGGGGGGGAGGKHVKGIEIIKSDKHNLYIVRNANF